MAAGATRHSPREMGVHHHRRRAAVLGAGLAAAALATACSSGGAAPAAPAAEPAASAPSTAPTRTLTVLASTNVWGDVVSKIAGPGVQVRSIINDPNTDPHSYESTPNDAAAISSADVVVYNGGGYDEFVTKALAADPAAKGKSIEAFGFRPDQGDDNEHVWFDTTAVVDVVRQVAQRLGQAEPAQAAQISQRAEAFAGQVDQIGQRIAAIGQARPGQRGAATEPVPHYLETRAGLADVTPEAFTKAIEEETDPPAAAVAETTDLITSRGVNVLFFNPQTESPVTEKLRSAAQAANIPIVNVTETLPPGTDYLGWLDGYRSQIATAVGAPQ